MIYPENTDTPLSDDKVVQILKDNGIKIVMKPVAIVKHPIELPLSNMTHTEIEMDIYEALRKLEANKNNDPFSL